MSFSERSGIVPIKVIQLGTMDSVLRIRLCNYIDSKFIERQAQYVLDRMGLKVIYNKGAWDIDLNRSGKNCDNLVKYLSKANWNEVYDAIEYGLEFLRLPCLDCTESDCQSIYDEEDDERYECAEYEKILDYTNEINSILELEKSGYRIIEYKIADVTNGEEIEAVENACSTAFQSVNNHMQKAVEKYSDRAKPDYENAIKEAICGVEAMCCIITGLKGKQGTLSNALTKLEENGVALHPAFKSALGQLYGFTCDAGGIRHGSIEFNNAPAEDAKFMLIACSAFINYLSEKYSKFGGNRNGQNDL